jgi:8-oxo-dGTP pyrophosphatase MutT (NUDIX family)
MAKVLTEDTIARKLHRAYKPNTIASTDGYAEMYANVDLTCAAVLVPLVCKEDGWHLLFTRRTDSVYHHKGQVSFPGGACDKGESTPEETALREANEEIGLKPERVRVLGRLNATITITHYRVTPVVGILPWPYSFRPAPREVGRVFTIPLQWLSNCENWEERNATPKGVPRSFPVIIYHPYDGEILWGATARMTQDFLRVLGMLKNK